MSTGDDPWAKWRAPEASVAVDGEKDTKTPSADSYEKTADRSPGERPARSAWTDRPLRAERSERIERSERPESVASVAPAVTIKPEGTLGVRRDVYRDDRPERHRPLRGGPVSKRDLPPPKPAYERSAPTPKPIRASRPPRSESLSSDTPYAPRPAMVRSGPPPEGTRLSKVMSERGICSRREADLWIERGWVFVNGEQVSELGSRINISAEITISTEAKKDQAKLVTILLHKPVGYVSGQPEPGCIPAVTLITAETQLSHSGGPEFKPWMLRGLAPAGRLDIDSTGLLVLTSDGRVAKRLVGEDSNAEKEYLVRVSGKMIPNGLDLLKHGLELDGKPLRPAWIKQLNEDQLHFILKEGKKRQIRRMCELVGLEVIGLKRVRIGRIRLGDLPMGQWRFMRDDEAF